MHLYEPPRHQIPAMRPARETPSAPSATPIYDALYAEYRRMFRTVPGDRGGEDELGLPLFGAQGQGLSHGWGHGPYGYGGAEGGYGAHGRQGAGQPAQAPHTGYGWAPQPPPGQGQQPGDWARPAVHPLAALPPGPRRGGG